MGVLTEKDDLEVLKEIEGTERIDLSSSLSWDGKNLLIRIPKEVSDFLKINKKNRFKKKFRFIIEEKDGKIERSFEITDREEPKRKIKKKNDK